MKNTKPRRGVALRLKLPLFLSWLLFAAMTANAVVVDIDGLKYDLNTSAKTAALKGLASGVEAQGDLIIPDNVVYNNESFPVTSIGDYAFQNCSGFTGSLTIPNSVTTIGSLAFGYCSGFTGSLTIPNSVTTIGSLAFCYCSGFTGSLTIPNSVTTIGIQTFYSCSGFTGSLTIPNSVTTIGDYAFSYCSGFTGSLTIPNSVTTIGNKAFDGCSGFTGSLTIPNSVTTIGDHAFFNCSGLTGSLTIPNSVTTIGDNAFWSCSGFTGSLTIPNSVTTIGNKAFDGCSGFTGSLTIGEGVKTIGYLSFYFTNFSEITSLAVDPPVIDDGGKGYYAFGTAFYKKPLYVPSGSVEAYKTAYEWKEFFHIQPEGYVKETGISLDRKTVTVNVGGAAMVVATVTPENATDKSVTWSTSDASIATVGSDGKITGVKIGNATITATSANSLKATCQVNVVATPAASIALNKTAATLKATETVTLEATVGPETATDKSVAWSSSDAAIATVDENGKVTAMAVGKAIITATSTNGLKATCEITVAATPAASITLNKTAATLKATETVTLKATVGPETATDKSVTWSTSDAAIATVDENGKVTAVAVGKATITATSANGLKATCEITVAETPASGIVIDKDALGITGDNLEMRVGDTKTIKVTVEPATTTDKAVTFTSSNASVASVDADGKVTALALGKTTITITAKSGVSTSINVTVVATPASSITLNKTAAALKATETVTLEATVGPETATDKSVTWSSSDAAIANVDENGKVTAVAVGKATITATTANGLKAICQVTVAATPAASITLNKTAATLKATETVALIATIAPQTTTDKSVTWSTSDASIATVDENGKVTAVAVGKAIITATSANGLKATCEITVAATPAASITLNRTAATLKATETVTLEATVGPETATDKSVTWSTSNASIATVDEIGKVTAIAVGKATITATSANGLKATCEITVTATPAALITLNKTAATLKATETVTLEATVGPETATDKSVTWSTSNASIATVDENGKVTAIAVGKATITATSANGLKATCEITVAETPASGIVIDKDALGITGDNLEMRVGDTKTIKVTVEPATTTDKAVTFTSSNAAVASVDADGKVTALALGKTTITITAKSGVSTSINVTVVATPAASITLNKTAATLKATETVTLEATVGPETATDKSVTWSTSDAAIATVDENGKVTAAAVGKAIITATSANGLKATCEITVAATPAASITLNKTAATLKATETVTLEATVGPETATDKSVTWETSDASIATVNNNGKVKAVAIGKATITATSANGLKATCEITVIATPATSITLNKTAATLKATETVELVATIAPLTTTDKSVTWSTSDASIATVDENGKVTAVAVGKATITATSANGLKATCEITVAETPASGIVIDKEALGITGDDLEMRVGNTKTIKVTVEPATATDKAVTFASSNEAVASVDADGKVTALALGQTTITIAAKSGVSASINVTVVATPAASIALNKTAETIKATETLTLVATVGPETATDKSVTWRSDNKNVATVDQNGKVTGIAVGRALISASTANGLTALCMITVVHRNVLEPEAAINGEQFDLFTGETLDLKVSYSGGLGSGWSFDWSVDGVQQPEGDKAEFTFAASETGNHSVSVRVTNNCDGKLIYDHTFVVEVNVVSHPVLPGESGIEVDAPSSATIGDGTVRVRQDDIVTLRVDEGRGGYADGWTYLWSTDGEVIGDDAEIETRATMTDGDTRAIERRTYSACVANSAPDGTVLAERTLNVAADIYRRPLTPRSLVRKGDGTTHTLICMLAADDAQLEQRGYGFVYGYEAADGSDHEVARTPKRYCRAAEQEYNDPANRFWVYAVWTYDDGCTVSSGKRYLDGSADESFNASVLDPSQNASRGADFGDSANWIRVTDDSVSISVDSDSDTFVAVYNTAGVMIRSMAVEAGTSVREQIDLRKLAAGIYIVNVTSGNESVSRKFIIK